MRTNDQIGSQDSERHPGREADSQLSPFQLKDELIRIARERTHAGAPAHQFLNAGRGNPNWIATTPREAFFVLGQFALAESQRTWQETHLGGMPARAGVDGRFRTFLAT